ncbi:MAG: DUF4492 domain-containing protein [Puniceicoccales bacterium]|jgi:hypothetical protein|nr:DUF4492 domain-containing protein [Puniceicoccales bacterium]
MTPAAFCRLFAEGFRKMTLGKTLWALVAVKLVILFCVLKPLFFRDYLGSRCATGAEKSAFVAESLAGRGGR